MTTKSFDVYAIPSCHVQRAIKSVSTKAQVPLGSSRYVATRHDTFDVLSSPCIMVVLSLSNSTTRHTRRNELDQLDTSNVLCRVVSRRDVTSQVEFGLITVRVVYGLQSTGSKM